MTAANSQGWHYSDLTVVDGFLCNCSAEWPSERELYEF